MARLKTIEILELFCFWGIQSFSLSFFFLEMLFSFILHVKRLLHTYCFFTGVFQLSLLEHCLENYNEKIN